MSNWPFVEYRTLSSPERSAFSMGPFGSKITKENYVDSGVPVIRGVNLARGIFVDEDFVFVGTKKADELISANVAPGDLIFTHRGTIGQVSMVPRKPRFDRYVIGSSQVKTRLDESIAVPEFYHYWFMSPEGQRSILANASTVGVPGIATPLSSIKGLRVPFPPRSTQRAVASVLGTLDEKILLNDRIATTAERLLRSSYETLADRQEQIAISDIGILVKNSTQPSTLVDDEPYIGLEHMPRRSMWLHRWGASAGVISQKSRFAAGDILFGKLRPYFHKVGVAQVGGVCSTDILVIRPSNSNYLPWLLMALSSDEVIAHATARSDGTRMPRARWSDLAGFRVPWARPSVIQRYTDLAQPMIKRVQCGFAESHRLSHLRDTLLPELMSGRLRVKDAEKVVEETV